MDQVDALQMSAIGILPMKAIETPFLWVEWGLGGAGKGLLASAKQVCIHLTKQHAILDLERCWPLWGFEKETKSCCVFRKGLVLSM